MDREIEGKPHVREGFKRFASKFYQQDFGEISQKRLHEGLLRFYVHEIHNALGQSISEDEFQEGLVDTGSDLGVDFIHRDDNTVLILQAKYKGCKSAVELENSRNFLADGEPRNSHS